VHRFSKSQEVRSKLKVRHNRTRVLCMSTLDSLTRGTSSWPWPADHRCRWPSMLATGLQSLARYLGAMQCWHLC